MFLKATFIILQIINLVTNGRLWVNSAITNSPSIIMQPQYRTDESWTNVPFDPSVDVQYINIKSQIDALKKAGGLTPQYIGILRQKLMPISHDPLAIYRYTYAIYTANTEFVSDIVYENAPMPHSFTYSRMRFIDNAESEPQSSLVELGKRLLHYEPNNYALEYNIIQCLIKGQSTGTEAEALHYGQLMMTQKPKDPTSPGTIADIYVFTWLKSQNKRNANAAIDYLHKWLGTSVITPQQRAWGQSQIQYINWEMNKNKK